VARFAARRRVAFAVAILEAIAIAARLRFGEQFKIDKVIPGVVIDLFSRKVVGWSMRPDMHRSLVIDALEMGLFQRRPEKGNLIFHSDRGCQYAIASMSRKGNCWDNAVTETLFGSLKVERLHGERFETIRQAKDTVLAWLLWYNRQRMHSTLNYLSPAEFENWWQKRVSLIAA